MKKLQKIQSELKAPKNQRNSFGKYNYRSCEDILEALKPLLEKYECTLTISGEIKQIGDIIYVESTCTFSDGAITKQVTAQAGINPNKKGMDISQSFGSSSSYARKYSLNGLFLIDDTKDADTQKNNDKEVLTEKHPKFTAVLKALNSGNFTVKDIENKYEISKELKTKLEK